MHNHSEVKVNGNIEMTHNHLKGSSKTNAIKLSIGFIFLIPAIWIMVSNINQTIYIPFWIKHPLFQLTTSSFIFFLLGLSTISEAIDDLRRKKITINVTISLALLVAFIYSLTLFFIRMSDDNLSGNGYFFDAVIEIVVIIFLGAIVDEFVTKRVTKNIANINEFLVEKAYCKVGNKFILKDIKDIKKGDIIRVKPGDLIALDGKVVYGKTEIDESAFTGESIPLLKTIGSNVFGGTISLNGLIHVRVETEIGNSLISKIIKGIEETKMAKPKSQLMADRISKVMLPFLLLFTIVAFIIWGSVTSDWQNALTIMISTLIIACPMSLVLITSFSSLFVNKKALKSNIKLQSKKIFESSKKVNVVAFDKTGTLTEGKMSIIENTVDKKYFSIIYSIEEKSNHSISKSILKEIGNEHKKIEGKYTALPGLGANLKTNVNTYMIGSLKYLNKYFPKYEFKKINPGEIITFLFTEKRIFGYIKLKDKIKESSIVAIEELKKMGIEPIMITGDNEMNAKYVANNLGIKEYYSEKLPNDKLEIIRNLKKEGKKVLFAGDGINDSISIEEANIGIAMNSGTNLSKSSADIVVLDNDLISIINSIRLINRTKKTVNIGFIVSLIWITGSVGISLAGLLTPLYASIGMVINDMLPLAYSSTIMTTKLIKR